MDNFDIIVKFLWHLNVISKKIMSLVMIGWQFKIVTSLNNLAII